MNWWDAEEWQIHMEENTIPGLIVYESEDETHVDCGHSRERRERTTSIREGIKETAGGRWSLERRDSMGQTGQRTQVIRIEEQEAKRIEYCWL